MMRRCVHRIKIQREETGALIRLRQPPQPDINAFVRRNLSVKGLPFRRTHAANLRLRSRPEHAIRHATLLYCCHPNRFPTPPSTLGWAWIMKDAELGFEIWVIHP